MQFLEDAVQTVGTLFDYFKPKVYIYFPVLYRFFL